MGEKEKPAVSLAPPYVVEFSSKVKAKYGYKDGHVELEVDLPFPLNTVKKTYTESFTSTEVKKLKEAVDKAMMWNDLPDYQRERDGAA